MTILADNDLKSKVMEGEKMHFHRYFMVERPEYLGEADDRRLMDAVEVTCLIQQIYKVNEILKSLGERQIVDVEIFHKVVDRMLNPAYRMSEIHIERFYQEMKKLEQLSFLLNDLCEVNFNLTSRIDYTILGLSYEEIKSMDKPPYDQDFNDFYFQVYIAFMNGKMDFSKFFTSVKNFLESVNEITLEYPS
ncbi:hypothetical protein M3P19_00920 [Muricauda sp. 2012CJ35-5]|uniref:Uncharacterized protein n=1 Tax=Flagellimonas spongiicola TaxID=2942208 RepID=A0ABT0PME4_9FLAO|nr:hypothetical protein [Allomuricauda spongiicola]MCL6272547.1 hypothetical protein [Allomuricauda spongiicola]